jgi:SpoVK/Ycf46/Vps4 family AAA+-type ATPase
VCREAALGALREDEEHAARVCARHFDAALAGVRAALSAQDLERYEAWPPRRGAAVLASP